MDRRAEKLEILIIFRLDEYIYFSLNMDGIPDFRSAHPGSINCCNWCKLCVARGILRHIAVTRTLCTGMLYSVGDAWSQMNAIVLPIPHAPASGRSANE